MPRKSTVKRKAVASQPTTNLLIQMMNDMNSKLHHIHKDVEKNSKDIDKLKEEVAVGRGGVKVLMWVAGMVTTILAVWKFILPR